MKSRDRRLQILIGVSLTLGGANLALGNLGERYTGLGPLFGREVLWWALVAVVLAFILFVERLPLSSIGFKRPTWGTLWAIPAGVLLVIGIPFIYFVVFPLLRLHMNTAEIAKLASTPLWYRLLLVTRAAVCEEILFRGYPIPRIEELFGRPRIVGTWIAAVVSWAAFTAAHLGSWGGAQLIVAGYGGVILTALYLWRRDLVCNILAHFIADGAGFLFG